MKEAGLALTVSHLLRSDGIEEFYDVIFDLLNNLAEDGTTLRHLSLAKKFSRNLALNVARVVRVFIDGSPREARVWKTH